MQACSRYTFGTYLDDELALMASPLPKHPQLRGNYAPINFEAVCQDLVIEGAVPEGLAGSLYRIGPNPKFVPDQGYHWFFGTGMVHAFHVHEGKIDYVNRWVRTPKFEAELAAVTSLPMSIVVDPDTGQLQSERRNGLANTHIIWHADQLLALEEGSHTLLCLRKPSTPRGMATMPMGCQGR